MVMALNRLQCRRYPPCDRGSVAATEQVAKVWQASDGLFLFAMQDTPERVDDRLAAVVGPLPWVPTTCPPDYPRRSPRMRTGKYR